MIQEKYYLRYYLKNYAINANLLVKEGNKIATMSQMKNIVSVATLPDTFEKEIAIYDLNEFLSAMSLFNDPELKFGDNSVQIVTRWTISQIFLF